MGGMKRGSIPSTPLNETHLRDLYETKGWTAARIGADCGVSRSTVMRWLCGYGIPRRKTGTALLLSKSDGIPSEKLLRDLYLSQKLSSIQIGRLLNIGEVTVIRWLKRYGIEVRPPGKGLVCLGMPIPSRDDLIRHSQVEGLSYEEIGKRYGVGMSAVAWWMKHHGIKKPLMFDTDCPPPEELIALYESGCTIQQVADRYGIKQTTLCKWFKKLGIQARPGGYHLYQRVNGVLLKSSYEVRVALWLTANEIPFTYEPRLPFDRRYCADFIANGWYIEIWGMVSRPDYRNRMKRKRLVYLDHKIPLIQIYPRNFLESSRLEDGRLPYEKRLYKCRSGLTEIETLAVRDVGCGFKLDEFAVKEIRKLYAEGKNGPTLARQFGVATSTISAIVNRRRWIHF